MLAGLPYRASDAQLKQEYLLNRQKNYDYNALRPEQTAQARDLLKDILGKCGEEVVIMPPFRCDYGKNIEIADNVFINYNCVILDVCRVSIGERTLLGPNVCISAAGHPLHPLSRRSGYEYGAPVTIGADVWIGANVVILPGVTIGAGTVVGAGSVVVKDLPAQVVAVGNPCRVLRPIQESDRAYYFKNHKFDVTDY